MKETNNNNYNTKFLKETNLSNQLIVAMPGQFDGIFAGTVVYICEHTKKGAIGIVLNRPTDLTLGSLIDRLDQESCKSNKNEENIPVYFGGPVQTDRGFVLHSPTKKYDSSVFLDDVAMTTSCDILQEVIDGKGPPKVFISLGYAGWGEGQLEVEISQNAWLNVYADEKIIFETPSHERYSSSLKLLGINQIMLSSIAGTS